VLRIVGISEMYISSEPDDIIITYSLGSCIGVSIYDQKLKIGGMVHCMLPLSKIDPNKALEKPCMFTDTGISCLLQNFLNMGSSRANLIIKTAGAASMLDEKNIFKIGERNYTVLKKIMWKNDLQIKAEDVKGTASRTMLLYMNSGKTTIKSGGKEGELI